MPCSGFVASRFATAATSPAKSRVAARQPPSEQKLVKVAGIWRQDVRGERVREVGRHHRIEQEPLDVLWMGERIRRRELRSVGHPEQGDLVDRERCANRLEILGVVAGAVEGIVERR